MRRGSLRYCSDRNRVLPVRHGEKRGIHRGGNGQKRGNLGVFERFFEGAPEGEPDDALDGWGMSRKDPEVPQYLIHHVSVPTRDLAISARFYEDALGLQRLPRPPFASSGYWYSVGDRQIHLIEHHVARFRDSMPVDNDDIHFALHSTDFESTCVHLQSLGYSEDLPADHPKRMILKRTGLAGFAQLFIMDPDRNILEINTAPFDG
jgi:glyoxylase I family protein